MTVAVLGGRGFLGEAVVRRFVAEGVRVVSVDRRPLDTDTGAREIQADVLDAGWRDALAGCELLVNLIGTGDHPRSMREPLADLHGNCATALAALEAARDAGVGRVAYASTRQVYGRPASLPVDETHPVRPIDVNGVNRHAAEQYHAVYARRWGVAYAIVRYTNLYGPSPRFAESPVFLARWLDRARRGEPFEVWGGEQIRNLLYVDDAASAMVAAARECRAEGALFNCGGDESVRLLALAERLAAYGLAYRVVPYPPERAPIEIGDFIADSTRLRRRTGWRPTVSLDEGLRRTLVAAGLTAVRG